MTHFQPSTVLLVEDEPIIGYEVQALLTDAGYVVHGPARTQSQARALMQGASIALAVVDLVLADGPCEALAQELHAQGIPVIITSGLMQDTALAALATAWVTKPYTPEVLIATVARLIPHAADLKAGPTEPL